MSCQICARPTSKLRHLEARTFHKIDKYFILDQVCDVCWKKIIKAVENTVKNFPLKEGE